MQHIIFAAFVAILLSVPARAEDLGASGRCMGPCDLHPDFRTRIQKDVAWLDEVGGITDAMIRNISLVCDAKIRHQCNVKVVRLMIKDGEVYLNSLHPNWRLGPPELIGFLLELYETSKMYKLPDLEFAYNGDDDAASPAFDWRDRKALKAVFHGGPFPLLAWSKGDASFAQLTPYSGAFRCPDDSFDALMQRIDEFGRVKWRDRRKVAFGRWNLFCALYNYDMPRLPSKEPFECPRELLPKIAAEHPDIMEVASLGDGERGRPVPLTHQNAFRYLVSTDGWAISSKFDKYLLLGSTIIKAASPRYGFYYDALRPGVHYVNCLNSSRTDILDVIRWLMRHEEEAARMGAAAQQFAVRHLHRESRLCYYRTLMEELGKRMRYVPDCSKRKLCLPVGRFLEFLSTLKETEQTCRYQEVFLKYDINRTGPYSSYPDDVIRQMLSEDDFWPRDTDIPPLPNEPYFPGSNA